MTDPVEQDILVKLEAMLEDGKQATFTEKEANLLRKIARFFLAISSLGPPGAVLLKILGYFAAIVIGWAAFKTGLSDLLRGMLNG